MNEVPNIISTKDLSYINDMLKWNMIAAKKANAFSKMVEDKEVKALIKKANKMHKKHYEQLMEILS